MLQLFDSISRSSARNSAAPAICGAARVFSYGELSNALSKLCGFFDNRKLPLGSRVYANITDPDIRLIVHLACIHYGLVPFVIFSPTQVPGQVDYNIVVGADDPLVPDLDSDMLITDAIFAADAPPLSTWGNHSRIESDLLLVATTSGTTGKWKLIAETCGHFSFQIDKSHDFEVGDRVMVIMGELALMTFRTAARVLHSGATLVRASLDPLTCLKLINLFAINKMIVTPKALEGLMDIMAEMSIQCPSLKSITVTGSMFTGQLLERAERMFDAEFIVLYGSAEVGGVSSGRVTSKNFEPGFVGEIRDYLDLHIDPGEEGEPGQVVLRNDPILIQRYYENGAAVPNDAPHYRMPDIGVIRENCLYLAGRDDEVFNFSGNKIPFSEMIGHLMSDDAISDAAIAQSREDPDPFALKVAIVEKRAVDLERLRSLLCDRLGRRGLAKHLDMRVVDQIPRNASGKIDREAMLRMFSGR